MEERFTETTDETQTKIDKESADEICEIQVFNMKIIKLYIILSENIVRCNVLFAQCLLNTLVISLDMSLRCIHYI